MQSGIVAFVVATLFLRTHIHSHTIQDANLVAGLLFFTLIQSLFSGIAEMTFAVRCHSPANAVTSLMQSL